MYVIFFSFQRCTRRCTQVAQKMYPKRLLNPRLICKSEINFVSLQGEIKDSLSKDNIITNLLFFYNHENKQF